MRLYDSVGSLNLDKSQPASPNIELSVHQHQQLQQRMNNSVINSVHERAEIKESNNLSLFVRQNRSYFKDEKSDSKGYKFNMEQSWNPVNNYIYGPAVQSIYNQLRKEESLKKGDRTLNTNLGSSRDRERDKNKISDDFSKTKNRPEKHYSSSHRKLLGEFINNETPRL